MALAFEQPDVRILPDNDIKVAVSADFLAEPHVTGMKPVVAASDDDLLPPGDRGRWGGFGFGEAAAFSGSDDAVTEAQGLAEGGGTSGVLGFIGHP